MSVITLDFETYYDNNCSLKKLTLIDYITHPMFSVHMVGIKIDGGETEIYEGHAIREKLEELFYPNNDHILIAHNTMFDGLVMQKLYGVTAKYYCDTMLMFHAMAHHLASSLEVMARTLFPNDKSKRKGKELAESKGITVLSADPALRNSIRNYCKNDVSLTYDCYQMMIQYFPQEEMDIIHQTLALWIEPRIMLDAPRVERHLSNLEREKLELIERSGIAKSVLSSNKKFAEWIEAKGMTVPMKLNEKNKPTYAFAKDDLEFTKLRNDHPEHEPVWSARIAVKSTGETTRAKRLLNNAEKDDGFIRVPLKYYGAHTGRYSGGEKINLQNLKRGSELRNSLIAPDNQLIFVSDLSQIEARMNAWLSGEIELLEDFRNGIDIYSKFAGENIYNRPVDRKRKVITEDGEEVYPDFIEGFVGKVSILGLGYQMSGGKFQLTLAKGSMGPPVFLSEDEADAIVYQGYRKKYRNIARNWGTAQRLIDTLIYGGEEQWGPMTVMKNRILLPNNMFLNYPNIRCEEHHDGSRSYEYWTGKYFTNIYGGKLVENVVQALARIVVMQQLRKITSQMPHINYALQVHDELIFTGPEERPDQTMADIIGYMSEPPSWCADLPVAAEGGYAKDYSK